MLCLATRSVLLPKIAYAENAIAAGALLGELVGWGADTHPHTQPHSAPLAPRCSRLRRLDLRAPPDTKSWRRHWAQQMPLPLTVSCFSKIHIGFTFWYRLT